MTTILSTLRPACTVLICGIAVFGFIYPAAVTALAQGIFPQQAHGSMIVRDGKPIGSLLIGQEFTDVKYFWGRPSATTPPYNAAASGASNLGPSNPDLRKAVQARALALRKADPDNKRPVPAELVEASASGLDPDISPEAAEFQVPRVAKARGLSEQAVRAKVKKYTKNPQLGLLGMPRVNVLELNMALDQWPVVSGQRSAKEK